MHDSWGAGYYPVNVSIESLLGKYFEIDPQKLSKEKDRMLDEFRAEATRLEKIKVDTSKGANDG